MISKQAQEFWALLKTYPKQIQMPLSQARETDRYPLINDHDDSLPRFQLRRLVTKRATNMATQSQANQSAACA